MSLLVAGFPAGLLAQAVAHQKLAASIERLFGKGAVVEATRVDSVEIYRVLRADSLVGFARVLDVKGKDQPITFLVAVDPGLVLKDVEILVYREPYGGEVAYEAWRRQFRGKPPGAPLEVGRDIRSISGATISVNAVTAGVRRAVVDFAAWQREGKLP